MVKRLIKKIFPKRMINAYRAFKYPNAAIMFSPEYNYDGLITSHTCEFMNDPIFQSVYKIAEELSEHTSYIYWRFHTVLWATKLSSHLEGDFIECGVNKAFMASGIVHYLDFNNLDKDFYLLDTFGGEIPLENITKEEFNINDPRKRIYEDTYNHVKLNFKDFDRVHIIKGKVPDTLTKVKSNKVAFLHLDMNNAYPELEAAEYFWDKIVSGGIILLDDYAYSRNYKVQREGFDNFAKKHQTLILTLATGQGMIIKA